MIKCDTSTMKSHNAPVIPKTLKINFPASAPKKKKKVQFDWPHSVYWGGQQQEVNVTDYSTSHISTALGLALNV